MQAPVQVITAKKYDLWLDGLPAMVSQQQLSLWQVKGPKPLCNCCKDSVAANCNAGAIHLLLPAGIAPHLSLGVLVHLQAHSAEARAHCTLSPCYGTCDTQSPACCCYCRSQAALHLISVIC